MSQFFKFHCGLKGRINRLAFFIWMALYYGFAIVLVSIFHLAFNGYSRDFTPENLKRIEVIIPLAMVTVIYLLWGWMCIANTVKRLHDMNLRGWWIFAPALVYIPLLVITKTTSSSMLLTLFSLVLLLVCLFAIIVIYCIKGTEGVNRFGSDSRERPVLSVLLGTDS